MRETAQAHIRNAMQIVTFLLETGEPAFLKGGSARTVSVEELRAISDRMARALRELPSQSECTVCRDGESHPLGAGPGARYCSQCGRAIPPI